MESNYHPKQTGVCRPSTEKQALTAVRRKRLRHFSVGASDSPPVPPAPSQLRAPRASAGLAELPVCFLPWTPLQTRAAPTQVSHSTSIYVLPSPPTYELLWGRTSGPIHVILLHLVTTTGRQSRTEKVWQLIPTSSSFGTPESAVPKTKRDKFPRMPLPRYRSLLALRGSMGGSQEADR